MIFAQAPELHPHDAPIAEVHQRSQPKSTIQKARLQKVSGQTEETGEAGARGGNVVGSAGEDGELALGRGWCTSATGRRGGAVAGSGETGRGDYRGRAGDGSGA